MVIDSSVVSITRSMIYVSVPFLSFCPARPEEKRNETKNKHKKSKEKKMAIISRLIYDDEMSGSNAHVIRLFHYILVARWHERRKIGKNRCRVREEEEDEEEVKEGCVVLCARNACLLRLLAGPTCPP